jgi:hypothetical protein
MSQHFLAVMNPFDQCCGTALTSITCRITTLGFIPKEGAVTNAYITTIDKNCPTSA